MTNIELTSFKNYDVNKMVFSDPIIGNIPQSKNDKGPALKYKRILISTEYENKNTGDLIFPTPGRLFSFGVKENTNDTGKVTGHVMSLCLYNRDEPTEDQKMWVEMFDNVIEKIKDHLLSVKKQIGRFDLDRSELKKLNPICWKRDENGEIIPGSSPVLYAKLIESNNKGILTLFEDINGNEIDPLTLLGNNYCYVNAAVKFESIFIGGNKILVQVKLHEVIVQNANTGLKRLLQTPKSEEFDEENKVTIGGSTNPLCDDNEPAEEPVADSDDEPKLIRKVIRKKKGAK